MKKLALVLALAPALALAGPQPAAGPPGHGPGDPARQERVEKRLRIARTVGLADALDLDEGAALKLRDTLARFDERRAPLRKQAHESMKIVRDAAQGDSAAAGQLDQALGRLRDARAQLQALAAEQLTQVTQGMPPQKKARAALFLARFQERAPRMMMHGGQGQPGPGMMGPQRGMRGMHGQAGPGMGAGPGMDQDRMAFRGAPPDLAAPLGGDEDDWFADE